MVRNWGEYSDAELFYKLKEEGRDRESAFSELYTRHSPRVYAYCRRFMGNKEETQDVFQETFTRFYQSSKQGRDMTNVPAFLLKIARNICVNYKRVAKNNVSFEDYMAVQKDNRVEQDELLNLIKMAIDLLRDDYKEVFILREYDGLCYADIAKITGNNLPTVKVKIYRAKAKIREILSPYTKEFNIQDKKKVNI